MLYSDDSDGQRVSLRYAPVQSAAHWRPAGRIQRQIDRMFAVLPNFEGVLFSITSSNQTVDGVYYLKLPVGGARRGSASPTPRATSRDAAGN